jgi:hypothetical protein
MSPIPSLRSHLVVGALQGLALWWLYEAHERAAWPATSPAVFGALAYAAVAAPLAWYLSHGVFASKRARVLFAVILGGCFGVLGAHAGSVLRGATLFTWSISHLLAAGVLGFVIIGLVGAWNGQSRRFDYPQLFELASRNAMLALVAGALTVALWVVLFAGAWLMSSIGIKGLLELYMKPAFRIPITAVAAGLSFGLVLARTQMLDAARHLALSLAIWFLPLALLFAVAWIAALPFTGVQPLFDTRNAAFYLLWFATLAIVFLNAAFQGGQAAIAYPPSLATSLRWAWLTMPVLGLLAGWALWQRIAQHGWTEDRIWAALAWLLVTVLVFGYAASVFRRRGWMPTVPVTNIVGALVLVVGIVALISPIADVQRLTVSSQLARLRTGAVEPATFDWNLLATGTGSYGQDALKRMVAAPEEDERSKLVAKRAAEALRVSRVAGSPPRNPEQALEILRESLAVRPHGSVIDERFARWLVRAQSDAHERSCITAPNTCALWHFDMNRDGRPEALLLWERAGGVQAIVYADGPDGWRRVGSLQGPARPLSVWLVEIDAGRAALVAREWQDLTLDGARFTFGR